ncbi:hypothetical protein [Lentibacter sp. XHP0401]|uniref:hypothetical protein n=1 Tax=Lentibacter sp. XHP0401 TaxID=2984334 RepID=UPI0021E738DF|nr:hypothetical protein [Lentibacter sp. XHP0401]MCV2891549.1 hypothetical protein [Lentibacter sp. XHP0401]
MKRFLVISAAALALAGCAPAVPDSGAPDPGAGVGFGDYNEYQQKQAAREAQLNGTSLPAASAVSQETLGGSTNDVAAEASAVLDATRPAGQAIDASPSNPAPAVINAAGISKENDFNAVDSQRTIQDDAARQAALKAQYQVVEATEVPTRAGRSGPNIVEYALSTSRPRGQGVYRRVGLNLQAKYTRNCAKYPSPDLAQSEFLERGGPERDRLGLDPDGDGYACTWDPAPFRVAKTAGLAAAEPAENAALGEE